MTNLYPFICRPEEGTVSYPFRRMNKDFSTKITKAFYIRLQEWLPDSYEVLGDVCVNVSEQLPPMKVDIAILQKNRPDLRIDVEIDVPYNTAGEPIHVEAGGDRYRDALMSRHGWTVVRFAGQQLLDDPRACADFLVQLDDNPTLGTVCCWTRSEALKMAYKHAVPYPEEVLPALPLCCFSDEERQCQLQVRPLPRTVDMVEKMAAFQDAGRYEQDDHIDFEPYEHIYILDGRQRLLPVSSLINYFFEEFNVMQTAVMQQERYGIDVEETLDKWDRAGKVAREVGTFVHAQTENYFRDGVFETIFPFSFGGETEEIHVEQERQQFLQFVNDYQIIPYRQEWPVYDASLNLAGTIDMICQEEDGQFIIYDWKRSGKLVNDLGQPITEGYGGKMSFNGINLPDTPFYHYCVQQNLYRYMLELHYGIQVKAMNLVVLHPENPNYVVVAVPKMDEIVNDIVNVCQMKDLGHVLLP